MNKKASKILMASLLCLSFLLVFSLAACKKTEEKLDSRESGSINIVVSDYNQVPLDGVTATLGTADTKAAVKKTSGGKVSFTDIKHGQYFVKLEKEGYASLLIMTELEMDANDNFTWVDNVSLAAMMYKNEASLSGKLYISSTTVNGTVLTPAAGASIDLSIYPYILSGTLINNRVTVVADNNGEFEFSNLPLGCGYRITPQDLTKNGLTYVFGGASDGELSKKVNRLDSDFGEYYLSTNSLKVAEINKNSIEQSSPIVVKFTEPVDISNRNNGIRVEDVYREIAINKVWSNSNKTLTITPALSGKWDTSFSLYLDVFSVDGTRLVAEDREFSISIVKLGALDNVQNLRALNSIDANNINSDSQMPTITWDALENASGYKVYYKTSEQNNYKLLISTNHTYCTPVIPSFSFEGRSIKFAVIGYNSESVGNINSATELEFKDVVSPNITTMFGSWIKNALGMVNYSFQPKYLPEYGAYDIHFNESMRREGFKISYTYNDTVFTFTAREIDSQIVLVYDESNVFLNYPLMFEAEWNYNNRILSLIPLIAPLQNLSNIDLNITLTNFRDINGLLCSSQIELMFENTQIVQDFMHYYSIDENTIAIPQLFWDTIPGAQGYKIYYKINNAPEWDSHDFTNNNYYTPEISHFRALDNTPFSFAEGHSIEFKVTAFDNYEESPLSDAPVIMLKDSFAPTISPSTWNLAVMSGDTDNLADLFNIKMLSSDTKTLNFGERMSKNFNIEIEIESVVYAFSADFMNQTDLVLYSSNPNCPLVIQASWSNNDASLTFSFFVNKGMQMPTSLDTTIRLSVMQDLAGNFLNGSGSASVNLYYW